MPCDHCTARYMRIADESKERCTPSRSNSRFPLVEEVDGVGLGIDEEVHRTRVDGRALWIIKRRGEPPACPEIRGVPETFK